MTLTVAYVRVSTEDQVEYSPDAQATRCRDLARQLDLGPVTVISDEAFSGKNLERPGMRKLLGLIEAGEVAHIVVWRLDRLSRDTGDLGVLVKLLGRHCVTVDSVNEGRVDLTTAAGRMQVGVHGVFAQFYREHIVENVKMGMEQAARNGRWLNRAPTGYSMVDGRLVASEDAAQVRRIFELRAAGESYPRIEQITGINYSTVRQIIHNRVYLGEVRLRDQWFPGIHEPLVTPEQFRAAQRGHSPGRRRGRDLLSGRVRCGICHRVVSVDYNERGQAIFRCWNRGRGCRQPGRSAKGLQRAAVQGLRVLATDGELQDAIRFELTRHLRSDDTAKGTTSRHHALFSVRRHRDKLFELYYADKVTPEAFAVEEARLTAQLQSIEAEELSVVTESTRRDELAERFEEVAAILGTLDVDAVWEEGTAAERRVLVEELIDAVVIFPDHLQVQVSGAPPINVTLAEVGLRDPGTRTWVSEGGSPGSRTSHWRLDQEGSR